MMCCKTCTLWQGVKDGEGACHRYPHAEYTVHDWWCGEYDMNADELLRVWAENQPRVFFDEWPVIK